MSVPTALLLSGVVYFSAEWILGSAAGRLEPGANTSMGAWLVFFLLTHYVQTLLHRGILKLTLTGCRKTQCQFNAFILLDLQREEILCIRGLVNFGVPKHIHRCNGPTLR